MLERQCALLHSARETVPETGAMTPRRTLSLVVLTVLMLLAVMVVSPLAPAQHVTASGLQPAQRVCAAPAPHGFAQCSALVRTDKPGGGPLVPGAARPRTGATPVQADVIGNNGAYDPAYLQSAYNFTSSSALLGQGVTVAIVEAFGAPIAEDDLAYYRDFFGLPPCSSATGCFKKVNQAGGSVLPPFDPGWALESALDLEMVSAVCPNCRLLLVEANDASFVNLGIAVQYAAGLPRVAVINNSYYAPEFDGETFFDGFYMHPGIAVTAASGDAGFGAAYPAVVPGVTAVGGTTLHQLSNAGSRSATETAWSGSGSGCSMFEPQPWWQQQPVVTRGNNACTQPGPFNPASFTDQRQLGQGPISCPCRMVADVAAVADTDTPVWLRYGGNWYWVGGTSVSSAIIAGAYGLAKDADLGGAQPNRFALETSGRLYAAAPYEHPGALFDVTAGSNGVCSIPYLCAAVPGYDGPTGLGTPNGIAAFRAIP
jgi:hypothetical protein